MDILKSIIREDVLNIKSPLASLIFNLSKIVWHLMLSIYFYHTVQLLVWFWFSTISNPDDMIAKLWIITYHDALKCSHLFINQQIYNFILSFLREPKRERDLSIGIRKWGNHMTSLRNLWNDIRHDTADVNWTIRIIFDPMEFWHHYGW